MTHRLWSGVGVGFLGIVDGSVPIVGGWRRLLVQLLLLGLRVVNLVLQLALLTHGTGSFSGNDD